jgi:5,10-methylenetetrahydromethanopterin reductase
MNGHGRIGVVFGSLTPPEELASGAELAEKLGFGELWFSEDCFFTGGLSGLTQLLASTRSVAAGLGLASVMTRHPAVLAMELAGLARMYPGRVRAAVGLGNRHWLSQMGLMPERPLTAVLETRAVLRTFLEGGAVDGSTRTHRFDNITLAYPPSPPPDLWIGAVNERALRAAGSIADGVLLSVLAGPAYIQWARQQIEIGASAAGRTTPPITAYVLSAVADEASRAREAVRGAVNFFVTAEARTSLVGQSGHAAAIRERLTALEPGEDLKLDDTWIDEFAVAGTPDEVSKRLNQILESGADSIGLWIFPADQLQEQLERIAAEILPAVSGAASVAHGRHLDSLQKEGTR